MFEAEQQINMIKHDRKIEMKLAFTFLLIQYISAGRRWGQNKNDEENVEAPEQESQDQDPETQKQSNDRQELPINNPVKQKAKEKKKPPAKYSLDSLGTQCTTIYKRKDIRSYSKKTLDEFFQILNKINSGDYPNSYENFAIIHDKQFDNIHQVAWTIFWHREFMWRLEQKLIEEGWKDGIPYWDWTTDAAKPIDSLLFKDFLLGGNGAQKTVTKMIKNKKNEEIDYSSDKCVVDGRLKNWFVRIPRVEDHCLKRNFGDGTGILDEYADPIFIEAKLSIKEFKEYGEEWESFPHGIVHDSINEDMGSHYSPIDFIFFLHHTFLDRIFWEWQQRVQDFIIYPEDGFRYEGTGINGVQATREDLIIAMNVPVKDTFNTTNGRYCYTYDRWNPENSKQLKERVNQIHRSELQKRTFVKAEEVSIYDTKKSNCTIAHVKPLSRQFLAKFKYDVPKHYLSISRGNYFIDQYNSLYCF